MRKTEPIKSKKETVKMLTYYKEKGEMRNYLLIAMGLFTGLRISDILRLKWGDVLNKDGSVVNKIVVLEKKTKKTNIIAVNKNLRSAVLSFAKCIKNKNGYVFKGGRDENKHLHRTQAYRIIKKAARELKLEGNISCHSLRKTLGYRLYEKNTSPILIMKIYNHSSFEITKRYLCIDQYEKDEVFLKLNYF